MLCHWKNIFILKLVRTFSVKIGIDGNGRQNAVRINSYTSTRQNLELYFGKNSKILQSTHPHLNTDTYALISKIQHANQWGATM